MTIYAMGDNGIPITCSRDAALYDHVGRNRDYVIRGRLSNLICEKASSTNTLNVVCRTGECVIQGRHVTVENSVTVTCPASSDGWIAVRYNTSSVGNEGSIVAVTELMSDDINDEANGIRDLPLYEFTSTGNNVTITSVRNFDDQNDYFLRGTVPNGTNLDEFYGYDKAGIWLLGSSSVYSYSGLPSDIGQPAYLEVFTYPSNATAGVQRVSNRLRCAQRTFTTDSSVTPPVGVPNDWYYLSNSEYDDRVMPTYGSTVSDCDLMINFGRYYANTSATHKPDSKNYVVTVFPVSTTVMAQMAFPVDGSEKAYFRSVYGATNFTNVAWQEIGNGDKNFTTTTVVSGSDSQWLRVANDWYSGTNAISVADTTVDITETGKYQVTAYCDFGLISTSGGSETTTGLPQGASGYLYATVSNTNSTSEMNPITALSTTSIPLAPYRETRYSFTFFLNVRSSDLTNNRLSLYFKVAQGNSESLEGRLVSAVVTVMKLD